MTYDLQILLERCGLTSKEATVYLALLELGESMAPRIAELADLKRATAHFTLDELEAKEVVVSRPHPTRKNGKLFKAVSPLALHQRQEHLAVQFKQALPQLLELNSKSIAIPDVDLYFGTDGMEAVWDSMLKTDTDILSFFSQDYIVGVESWLNKNSKRVKGIENTFLAKRLARKQWLRGLIPYEPNKAIAQNLDIWDAQRKLLLFKAQGEGYFREYYFINREQCPFEAEISIYGDNVALSSYYDGSFSVMKSKHLAQMNRLIFFQMMSYAKEAEADLLSDEDQLYIEKCKSETPNPEDLINTSG